MNEDKMVEGPVIKLELAATHLYIEIGGKCSIIPIEDIESEFEIIENLIGDLYRRGVELDLVEDNYRRSLNDENYQE